MALDVLAAIDQHGLDMPLYGQFWLCAMKRFQTPACTTSGSHLAVVNVFYGMAIFGGMVALSKRTSRKHRV
jgi:hypothetical protein